MQNTYIAHGSTLAEQYYDIGKLHANSILRSSRKRKRKWGKRSTGRRQIIARVYDTLLNMPQASEFVACMDAWARGAGITAYEALELLDDNSGCQTVMAATAGDGILLAHIEEDMEDIKTRMTDPRIIGFTIDKTVKYSLIYNDLMPGAGVYGWSDHYAIAIDSLFLHEDGIEAIKKPMLANIASWIVWRSDLSQLEIDEVQKMISGLGTYIDGYAINIVRKFKDKLQGYRITFTRDTIETEVLPDSAGSYLRQINIIDPEHIAENREIAQWRTPPRKMYKGYWHYFLERLKIIDNDMREYARFTGLNITNHALTHRVIQSEITKTLESHYINKDVGAVCLAIIEPKHVSVSIGFIADNKSDGIEFFNVKN